MKLWRKRRRFKWKVLPKLVETFGQFGFISELNKRIKTSGFLKPEVVQELFNPSGTSIHPVGGKLASFGGRKSPFMVKESFFVLHFSAECFPFCECRLQWRKGGTIDKSVNHFLLCASRCAFFYKPGFEMWRYPGNYRICDCSVT